MKKITVFTPTFNRAFCLGQLYTSLGNQTNKDFVWMIIDDGSNDKTNELVQSWIDEGKIQIQYIFKENGGMHSAHNIAYKNITSELNICIDSDDFMPTDAIEKILTLWKYKGNDKVAGIIGLDSDKEGKIIGSKIPDSIALSTLNDLYQKYQVSGDKKLVLRTAVVKKFPLYPLFPNEKLVPLGTLYLMIDQQYQYICTNDVYCIVEYLEDGSSKTIFKQYRKSPRGFGYNRIVKMQYSKSFLHKYKNAIHLVSSAIFAKDFKMIFSNPFLILKIVAIPFGIVLNMYIRFKIKFS